MYKSKLVQLLRALDKEELSQFINYVHSPFFNKHEKTKKLCDLLVKRAPGYKHKSLAKETIYLKLFGKIANVQHLNYVTSNLLQLLTDYLSYCQYQKEELSQKQLLLKDLLQREQYDLFEKYAKPLEKKLETIPL